MEIFFAVVIYLGIGLAFVIGIGARHPMAYVLWPVFWPFIILANWSSRR